MEYGNRVTRALSQVVADKDVRAQEMEPGIDDWCHANRMRDPEGFHKRVLTYVEWLMEQETKLPRMIALAQAWHLLESLLSSRV